MGGYGTSGRAPTGPAWQGPATAAVGAGSATSYISARTTMAAPRSPNQCYLAGITVISIRQYRPVACGPAHAFFGVEDTQMAPR